ncbi:MAG: hypothetical protein LUC22_00595, partial [Prevotella sp.]|nr:hypothetical protein [Prevotella sp.]
VLTISTTSGRAYIDNIIVYGVTDGIQLVNSAPKASGATYNLAGQRVNAATYKGIVVRDGRKYIK